MSVLKIVLLTAIGFYLLLVLALYFFQDNLIFLAVPLEKDYPYAFDTPFEERDFEMEDGASINALHFKSEDPRGIIYYHHGNAGNLARWGEVAEYFVKFGYDVLIYDYRGYGKSTGKRTEATLHRDAQYLYDQLKQQWKEDEIVLYGRSMGSGMACRLAANNAPKLLILESPFYSLKSMAHHRFPFLPTRLLVNYDFLNWQHLQQADLPIHIFHGTDDAVVPLWSGQQLYEAITDRATFTEIAGGGHNDLINFEAYHKGIRKILGAYVVQAN